MRRTDGASLSLGTIEAPWAKDATGRAVRTSYSLEGDTIVQHIHGKDIKYPVVADPGLTFGVGVYLNMFGAEVNTIAAAIIAAGGAGAVAVCSGFSKLPAPLAKLAALVCTAVGAPTLKAIYNSIVNLYKNGLNNSACYQKKILPNTGGWKVVKAAGNCRA